jgi:hypothetical protein
MQTRRVTLRAIWEMAAGEEVLASYGRCRAAAASGGEALNEVQCRRFAPRVGLGWAEQTRLCMVSERCVTKDKQRLLDARDDGTTDPNTDAAGAEDTATATAATNAAVGRWRGCSGVVVVRTVMSVLPAVKRRLLQRMVPRRLDSLDRCVGVTAFCACLRNASERARMPGGPLCVHAVLIGTIGAGGPRQRRRSWGG